ncbi:sensor histidine kinase [Aeromicrobium sp. P5_D10]
MRERSELLRRLDSIWIDIGLTAMLLVIPVLLGLFQTDLQFAFDILLILPLILRRHAPVLSFTAISTLLLLQAIGFDQPRYGDVALLFGLYAIAAFGPKWAVWASLGTGFLGSAVGAARWGDLDDVPALTTNFVVLSTLVFAAWLLGYLARTRRAYVASLEERAAQLERDAEQQTQIATAAERARIAREMHDVVAHSLSVMVVQADGALYAAQKRPEQALDTLRTISATGRASLTEMRKLLGLLRDGEAEVDLAPLPTATDIPAMIQQLRDSGLTIELQITGDLDQIESATGLTMFRVVQEALTNTLKHAGPQVTATVDLLVTTDAVHIRVDDDGRGGSVANDEHGHGIVGIRERIAVHAGEVTAAPRPGGGFRVLAVIPMSDRT